MTIIVDSWVTAGEYDPPPDTWVRNAEGVKLYLSMDHERLSDGLCPRFSYVNVGREPSQVVAQDVTGVLGGTPRVLTVPARVVKEPLVAAPAVQGCISTWQEELHEYGESHD